jgi:hypothetical protein
LKVNTTTLSSYYLKTEVDTLLTSYYTQNYIDVNYDTSTEVDTKIAAISNSFTDNVQGDGTNSYQIYDSTTDIIRRLLPASPLTMMIPDNNGEPEDNIILIGINTNSFSTT